MRLNESRTPLLAVLALAGVAFIAGCDNSKSPPEQEPDTGRDFIIEGSFYQTSYDPNDGQSLYTDSSITTRGTHGATSLVRWDLETGNHSSLRAPSDYNPRDNTGRLVYRQSRTTWGATNPQGNSFFMMGPEQGLTFAMRKPENSEILSAADLSGQFYCVRLLGEPVQVIPTDVEEETPEAELAKVNRLFRRAQLLSAEFTGSGAFSYTVLKDSRAQDNVGASAGGTYELSEDGKLTLLSDGLYPDKQLPGGAGSIEVGEKEEIIWGGGFQKADQFLTLSYMIGEKEPTTTDRLNPDTETKDDEVSSLGFMACLKGTQGMTNDLFKGQYWFGRINGVSVAGTHIYSNAFGHVLADGVGVADRVECQSSDVRRSWKMDYQVGSDGSLVLNSEGVNLFGVVGSNGDMALLMHTTESTLDGDVEMGIDILMKKLVNSECPAAQ